MINCDRISSFAVTIYSRVTARARPSRVYHARPSLALSNHASEPVPCTLVLEQLEVKCQRLPNGLVMVVRLIPKAIPELALS